MSVFPDSPAGYSLAFDRALMVAALVHARQKRKGTDVPYLTHPVHVAMVLARHGFPEPALIAAVLHDVIEDIQPDDEELQQALRETFPASLREAPEDRQGFLTAFKSFLRAEFDQDVLRLVEFVTDDKYRDDGTRLPWAESKARSYARLGRPETPDLALALKAADALHNARQVVNDIRAQGLRMMKRFNATPEDTLHHYANIWRVVAGRFGDGHPGQPLAQELGQAVQEMARTLDSEFETAHERVRQVIHEISPAPGPDRP
jgi:(p)ppGpp synthase/HD superfamily hydrolase